MTMSKTSAIKLATKVVHSYKTCGQWVVVTPWNMRKPTEGRTERTAMDYWDMQGRVRSARAQVALIQMGHDSEEVNEYVCCEVDPRDSVERMIQQFKPAAPQVSK